MAASRVAQTPSSSAVSSPVPPPPPPPPPPPISVEEDEVFSIGVTVPNSVPIPITGRVQLRPLYWKKVQDTDKILSSSSSTVWRYVHDDINSNPDSIDYRSLRTLFIARAGSSRRSLSSSCTSNVVRLLDCKRSQAISILLRSLPEKGNELSDLSNCEIDPNILISIADLIPSKKEMNTICSYTKQHPGSILDAPEQFLIQVSKVNHFKEKAKLLLHESQFSECHAAVQTTLTMLHNASKNLHKNNEVNKVLGIILSIGNKLNAGNQRRGNAKGFELDILGKLKDVKSNDGSTNLLEYIVKSYLSCTKKSQVRFPLPCPLQLSAASKVSFEDLYSDIEFLSAQLKASDEIQKIISVSPQDKSAVFLTQAHKDLKTVKSQLSTVESLFHEMLEYYCIDKGSATCTPQTFFHLWIPFLQSFKHYWKSEITIAAPSKLPLESLKEELLRSFEALQKRPLQTSKSCNSDKANILQSKHTVV